MIANFRSRREHGTVVRAEANMYTPSVLCDFERVTLGGGACVFMCKMKIIVPILLK